MKISRDDIICGELPPKREQPDGGINVVLALRHPDIYAKDGSNSYIPCWDVVNTEYYCHHPEEYLGWIDLEDIQWDDYESTTHMLKDVLKLSPLIGSPIQSPT